MQKMKSMKATMQNRNMVWLAMVSVPMILLILLKYIPMGGIIIAFKKYRFSDGIFGSEWVGLKNFSTFLMSRDLWVLLRNTIGYNVLFLITSLIAAVFVALLLYELRSRIATKIYQTIMITPHFVSMIIVGYIAYAFLNPSSGVINNVLESIGLKPVEWYSETVVWPFILSFVNIWKGVGMNSVIYYAALMGIDSSIFEAADIDGANKWQKYMYVLVPCLIPTIVILLVLNVGSILGGDFGLFYYITRDVGALRQSTDIINTYTMRLFRGKDVNVNYSLSTAISLIQSVVGVILVTITNKISKMLDEDLGLF